MLDLYTFDKPFVADSYTVEVTMKSGPIFLYESDVKEGENNNGTKVPGKIEMAYNISFSNPGEKPNSRGFIFDKEHDLNTYRLLKANEDNIKILPLHLTGLESKNKESYKLDDIKELKLQFKQGKFIRKSVAFSDLANGKVTLPDFIVRYMIMRENKEKIREDVKETP